ncbi:PREDICTED: uncharacterized protein LOC106794081 [Polistes canadensis]|uniref:uncharacterized protein LOC106794081 n=1 Tax=Polistes canadensis TaxID=91411 RepID=UPI000718D04B|nr:PREDICTED: uncharacterized protein LOC106794081 [Polistes canadensis]
MHKLAKGLKKKKKSKKNKKGEEEEFDPEELERYRRERAERAERAEQKAEDSGEPVIAAGNAGSDEWQKFEALTAGVDSLLKKTQGDLDRIKSVSFFQRKPALVEEKKKNKSEEEEQDEEKKSKSTSKKWIGFDEEGNLVNKEPGEGATVEGEPSKSNDKLLVSENGFVEIPDDEDEQEDSADEDIFDTTYVDVLQNIDVQLAYIPDSPVEENLDDDPFDTTNAEKVLKTVDKKGNKLVSLGNAVEILSGRIDHVSTCKLPPKSKKKSVVQQDLLLEDFEELEGGFTSEGIVAEPIEVEKTLLDDDSDLPDIPIDLTKLPTVLPKPVTPVTTQETEIITTETKETIDITEFELLKEKTILEEIPDLDDAEFDLTAPTDNPIRLEEAEDPFGEKEPIAKDFQTEIIEASFEAATFVDEEDPFDTTFAENILPGKTELKFIEKELEELPISTVSISLTDPAGLNRDYETGLPKLEENSNVNKKDLLSSSTSDLSLIDPPIAPVEELTYVDPFDTSAIKEIPPGQTELKFLERELLGEQPKTDSVLDNVNVNVLDNNDDDDDDFDPRKETPPATPIAKPPLRPSPPVFPTKTEFKVNFEKEEEEVEEQIPDNVSNNRGRKASRPEIIDLSITKSVAFELPTPSNRPDLLTTTDEEKSLPSKPLTPYYTQKSIEKGLPSEDEETDLDPFDTSFVTKVTPGKTELKLIESELLEEESKLSHSLSDHEFNPRSQNETSRRKSDFTVTSFRPNNLEFVHATVGNPLKEIIETKSEKKELTRRESLLDAEVKVDAKPLTPKVESKTIEEEEISYVDPFDTSIAVNILPGKAELKVLESELEQITEQIRPNPINLSSIVATSLVPDEEDFNPRADEVSESKDFLCTNDQDLDTKVLTPVQSKDNTLEDDIDPFDTSFATIGPGKTELKILESELMQLSYQLVLFTNLIKMDSKGGNPFLMDDYTSESDNSVAGQQELNPFLESFTGAATTEHGENPFLNITSDQSYQAPVNVESTNPFASFCEENIFHLPEDTKEEEEKLSEPIPQPVQAKNEKPPPSRPPPPRPQPPPPPPPKNTKDLILSVTGAMDATSNHLLDRLQATRTPSPTLIHSPSPTPEHSFADFLDVDGNVPDLIPYDNEAAEPPKSSQDILDLFDAPNTDTTSTATFTVNTTNLITDVAVTSTTQENPFANITDEEIDSTGPAEGAFSSYYSETKTVSTEKRPSVSSTMAFPIQETENQSVVDLDFSEQTSVTTTTTPAQINSVTATELFSTESTEQISTTVDTPFFSISDSTSTAAQYGVTETSAATSLATTMTQQINQPIFSMTDTQQNVFSSDLLGDFNEPAKEVGGLISTSPLPAAEYPGTDSYRSDTQLDNFTATTKAIESTGDAFDAFASKFDKAAEPETNTDPFLDAFGNTGPTAMDTSSDVWGDSSGGGDTGATGFEENDGFDSFLSMTAPPQSETKVKRTDSGDSDEPPDFSVFIKPKDGDQLTQSEVGPVPVLAPPPKSPQNAAYADSSSRFNPFDKTAGFVQEAVVPTETAQPEMTRTDSQETPPTPLFDEDVSQPLEDFPRVTYTGDGWEMQLRQPNKKKITGQRFWKKIFVKLVYQGDNPVLQLFNGKDDKDPFQELPLLACYSVSDIGAQQFDQYGKIFTVKLQYIFYKERPGVRPGQVTKAERLTNKLSQFAAYAIQGDYQGVKEFGSDLKKLGRPVEHAAQISQLFKLGSQNYEDMKTFSCAIEEALFRLSAHRERALTYKMEEVQITVVDELYVEQSAEGYVEKQIARVRLFFLGFLTGMPDVELGINDMWRQGKEVVGRHDIIPVVTEEWIRLENVEFHSCVQQDEYEKSRIIKFKPPDACYIELMRFRVRPPKNRELPLQLKAVMCVTGNKVELRADILVPGFASRKLGQIPCEDVMVRFPIPECWIYLFRVEKHFRYGSVKSAHRRTGKIKGIERFLGAVDTLEPQLMEVTSGQAKYEHQHRAIVWRMPRLPKEGQGAYTTHQLVCRMALTSYDQIPENLAEYCYVEFTMPATQVSHTTARSVSFQNSDSDSPPEKYVRNLSRHEYRVGIEHTQGEGPGAYVTATLTKKIPETTPETHGEVSDTPAESDSDSSE